MERKNREEDKVKTYYGDKELSGELETAVKIVGNAKLRHVYTKHSITITGKGNIKDSHLGHLTIEKPLNAKETTFKTLTAYSSASLRECEVQEYSDIKNELTAEKSTFYGPLAFRVTCIFEEVYNL